MASQDLGSQAVLQQQINVLLEQRSKQFSDQEASLSKQLKLMMAIKDAATGAAKGLEGASKTLSDVAKSEKEVAEAAEKATGAQKNFTEEIKKAADESEELNKRLETASKVAGAFGDALSGATGSTFGLIKAGGNLVGTLFNVGKTILSIPFKLWDAFVDKSMNVPYNPAFRQALEDTRKSFGDLGSGAGKQVLDTYEKLRASTDKYGLSLRKIFGVGVEGRAAALKFVGEMSGALGSQMGPILEQVGSEIREVMLAMKGLGLSAEENGAAMKFFYNSGQNASKMMQEMGRTAAMMAKQTGFNIKTLGKAMVETIQVFPQFAKGGVQAMAKVAHYTHNLGIEVKDLQSVFDKFDSFDQAAESASQLSQAFGVNIDAMKMVKEQDPTKRLEALRNAFKAAGKDINSMTSAERKLAESTVGLSGAAFEAAMGEGNKKKALSESEKAAKAATHAAKDQTAAMKQLAKSIERIIPPQAEKFKGFFDAFTKGFSEGMFYSKNFGGMMRSLQASFRQIYLLGRDLGRLFFDMFPGMDKIASGFKDIFNPEKFAQFRIKVKEIFIQFFKDLEKDPKAGFQTFFERMKNAISNIFGGGAGGGLEKMKEGFSKFTKAMGVVLGEALGKVVEMAIQGIINLIDSIAHPEKFADTAKSAGGFISNLFGPMVEKLKLLGPRLLDAILDLGKAIFTNPKVQQYLKEAGALLGKFFAAKFAMSLAVSLGGALAKAGITSIMQKAFAPAAAPPAAPAAVRQAGVRMGPGGAPAVSAMRANQIDQQGGIIKALSKIDIKDIGMATVKLVLLAGMVTVGLAALIGGLALIFLVADPTKVALWGAALIPLSIAIGILGGITALLAKVNPGDALKASLVVGLIGLVLVGLAAIASQVIPLFDDVKPGSIGAFAAVIVALSGALSVLGLVTGAIAMMKLDPVSAAIAVAIIAALGVVLTELSLLVTGVLMVISALITEDTAKKMVLVAQAFATFADGMSSIGTAVMKFALAAFNPIGLAAGVVSLIAIATIMTEELPKMMKEVLGAMAGIDPAEVKAKMEAVNQLTQALNPLVTIAVSLNSTVSEMADEDIDAAGISSVLDKMKGAFTSILSEMKTFVTDLVAMSSGLSPAQVESVKAVGPILTAAASLVSAMMGPAMAVIEGSKDASFFQGKLEEIDPDALEKNLTSMTTAMSAMAKPIGALLGKGGPIDELIKVISGVSISKEQAEGLGALGGVMKEVIGAVKFFIDSFASTTTDEKTKKVNMTMVDGLGESLIAIRSALFDGEKGFMTGIVADLLDPKKFPIDVTKGEEIKKKAELIGTLLGPVRTLTDIVKDLPQTPPAEGKKAEGFFSSIKTALFGEDGTSTSLRDLLSNLGSAMAGVDIKQSGKIAKLKPFFDSLASMSTSIKGLGESKIDFAPVDWNLRSFATLFKPGYSMSDFIMAIDSKNPIMAKLVSGEIDKFAKAIGKVKNILDDMKKITEIKSTFGDGGISGLGTDIEVFAEKIVSADGKLTNALKPNEGIAKIVKDIGKMGKINVSHNIPGVTMVVNVSLDSKEMAKQLAPQIIRVDLDKTNTKSRVIETKEGVQRSDLL